MIKNDGKGLEELVAEIERVAKGNGFNIEVNQKIYNADGVQLSEFDIIISDEVGVYDGALLIECRDRPSQGAASSAWIEQLYGRKHFHNFFHVIAVSTTGFSPGAVHLAQKGNIELRVVSELQQPEKWLCNALVIHGKTGEFFEMRIYPDDKSGEMKQYLLTHLSKIANETLLHFSDLSEAIKPLKVFENVCLNDKHNLYEGLLLGERKSVVVEYLTETGPFGAVSVFVGEKCILLEKVVLYGAIWWTESKKEFSSIHSMKDVSTNELIGQRIVTDIENDVFQSLTFYETVNEDGTRKLSLRLLKK